MGDLTNTAKRPYESFRPPNDPWKELPADHAASGGFLTVYYSDDLSRLPVRFVTKPGDNKADPNLETLTFGLFTTCNRALRSSVVRKFYPYIFFVTNHSAGRVLSGYYRIRWYAQSVFEGMNDICLAADRSRFIDPPIPVGEVDRRCKTALANAFRGFRILSPHTCRKILALVNRHRDATSAYVEEIDRLEHINLKYGGYRYIGWKQREKFSWALAAKYFKQGASTEVRDRVLNTSPTGRWSCTNCGAMVNNASLLKRCPECAALASLRPIRGGR